MRGGGGGGLWGCAPKAALSIFPGAAIGHSDCLLLCRVKLAPRELWKLTPGRDHSDTDSRDEAPTHYAGP